MKHSDAIKTGTALVITGVLVTACGVGYQCGAGWGAFTLGAWMVLGGALFVWAGARR